MDLENMEKLQARILCNAEPFGFGPSAAIAQIARRLRPYVTELAYIGSGHTLDLQLDINYDAIFEVENSNQEQIRRIIKDYDIILTAMDFEIASLAKKENRRVIIYDALAWYWKDLPNAIKECDLYLAQDFIGVINKLAENVHELPRTVIVPPLVELPESEQEESPTLFVNLGGISNPFWPQQIGENYSQLIASLLQKTSVKTLCVGSSRYSAQFSQLPPHSQYRTLAHNVVQQNMLNAQILAITPGLGNIYEAALSQRPTILLPPVNDSQGQQMKLLQTNGYSTVLDWHTFLPIPPINYFDEQSVVLKKISEAIKLAADNQQAHLKFAILFSQFHNQVKSNPELFLLSKLNEEYGKNGLNCAVRKIYEFVRNPQKKGKIEQCLRPEDRSVLQLHDYEVKSDWNLTVQSTENITHISGTLSLKDEHSKNVTAHFRRNISQEAKPLKNPIEELKSAGFTHFAHTTRPENIQSIIKMRKIVPGNKIKKVLFGDPLGKHDHILGQLVKYDGTPESLQNLLNIAGYRTPILLFPIDSLSNWNFHMSKGYPFGHYITYYTSDGRFFPSFRMDNDISLTELLDDPQFHMAHEVVLKDKEISVEHMTHILISEQHQSLLPPQLRGKIVVTTRLPVNSFLQRFPPYSGNSYDVVTFTLQNHKLTQREIIQLMLREIPELGEQLQAGKISIQEIYNSLSFQT